MNREALIKEYDEWIECGARDMNLINGSFPLMTKFHYAVGVADPDKLGYLIKYGKYHELL